MQLDNLNLKRGGVVPGCTERGDRSQGSKSKAERRGRGGIQELKGNLKMIAPALGLKPVVVALQGIVGGIQAR